MMKRQTWETDPFAYVRWRSKDQHAALEEGWCVIYSTGRACDEIQRDDDQPRFKTDAAAKRHVRNCARAGSLLHLRALAFVSGFKDGSGDGSH